MCTYMYIFMHVLIELIWKVWDPLSSVQSSSLISLIEYLIEAFPTIPLTHLSYQTMFKTIVRKSRMILEKDIFVPIFSPE